MLTKRLPLVGVFAGGCLLGGVLVGLTRGREEPSPHPVTRGLPPIREEVVAPRAVTHEVVEAPAQPVPAEPTVELARAEPPPEQGRSVAEVLSRLEAAYRDGLVAGAPLPRAASEEAPEAAVAPSVTPAEPARVAEAVPAATAPTPTPVAPSAVAANTVPPSGVPAAPAALPASSPGVEPTRDISVQAPAPSRVAEGSDVVAKVEPTSADARPNVVVTVNQGDVYQLQQIQQLQVLQLIALSQQAGYVPQPRGARGARNAPSSAGTPYKDWGSGFSPVLSRAPGSLYLENPWGFRIPESVLVR